MMVLDFYLCRIRIPFPTHTPSKQVIASHTYVRIIANNNDLETHRHSIVWRDSLVFSTAHTHAYASNKYARIHPSDRTVILIYNIAYVFFNFVKYVYCVLFLAATGVSLLSFARYQKHCVYLKFLPIFNYLQVSSFKLPSIFF